LSVLLLVSEHAPLLIEEQAQFSHDADVGEGDGVPESVKYKLSVYT
jgi:hypothetical protein